MTKEELKAKVEKQQSIINNANHEIYSCVNDYIASLPYKLGDKCFYNIVSVSNIDVSMANVSGDIIILNFSDVMEDNTFADGTPFGVKIE